jgi:hypothetical protein
MRRFAAAAIAVVAACGGSSDVDRSVVLFVAEDAAGGRSLFQLDPHGAVTSVAALDGRHVLAAAFARDGTGGAAIVTHGSDRSLVRWNRSATVTTTELDREAGQWIAVSTDAATVAMSTTNGFAVRVRDAAPRAVAMPRGGSPAYGIDLSADGSALAFSEFAPGCGLSRDGKRCAVTQYVVDLTSTDWSPIGVAGGGQPGDGLVAYDGHFLDEAGRQLLYMTSAGDRSDACRDDINRCHFVLRRIDRDGTGDELVIDDAILGRRASAGAVVFRRPGPGGFMTQSLWIAAGGKERELLERVTPLRMHAVSPRGDRVVALTDSPTVMTIVPTAGGPARDALELDLPIVLGWATRALPAGARRVAEPARVRTMRAAIERARAVAGSARLGALDVEPGLLARLSGVEDVPDSRLAAWLDAGGHVVAKRTSYCAKRKHDATLELADRGVGSGWVTMRRARGAGGTTAIPPDARARARFTFPNGGAVELVDQELPSALRPGVTVEATLTWRVIEPPPNWNVFVHIDSTERVLADHDPSDCGASSWRPGDVIVDRFPIEIPPQFEGSFRVHLGWFDPRSAGMATRATISEATSPVTDGRLEAAAVEIRR